MWSGTGNIILKKSITFTCNGKGIISISHTGTLCPISKYSTILNSQHVPLNRTYKKFVNSPISGSFKGFKTSISYCKLKVSYYMHVQCIWLAQIRNVSKKKYCYFAHHLCLDVLRALVAEITIYRKFKTRTASKEKYDNLDNNTNLTYCMKDISGWLYQNTSILNYKNTVVYKWKLWYITKNHLCKNCAINTLTKQGTTKIHCVGKLIVCTK